MLLNKLAIKQNVTVLVFLFIVLIVGGYSYYSMPREAEPEVVIPYIVVTVTYQGVAPEDMESLVTIPIERKLTGMSGVKKIQSTSVEGASTIVIEFRSGTDIESALQKVRDKVSMAKADIPPEADEPFINEINISELPVILLSLRGDIGLAALNRIAEDIEDDVEAVKGVLDAVIVGGLEREIQIEVDPVRVAQYGVSLADLAAITRLENVNTPSGALELGEAKYLVRVPGEFQSPDELTGLVIKRGESGVVYLRDIATIKDTFKDPASLARVDGKPAIVMTISKRAGENIISMSDEVRRVLAATQAKLPPGTDIVILSDEADFVRDMVSELENSILSGLILVLACIFLFMGVRNAVFIAVAIPVSMLITFAILHFFAVTLNIVVLFSLILVLGNLVDCSIVVVENTYRHMQMGMRRVEAAYTGASEVAWPIIGSTFTTVAGFFPLLFWPGIMGDFMSYLPMTVIIALLASLFVGMVVNPALASLWMPIPKRRIVVEGGVVQHNVFLRAYGRILRTALRWRLVTATVFCTILLSVTMVFKAGARTEFFPVTEPRKVNIDIDCPQGTSLETSDRYVREVEARITPEREDMQFLVANVGSRGVSMDSHGGSEATHLNRVAMRFPKIELCKVKPSEVVKRVRPLVGDIPGAEIRFEKEEHGPPTGPPINIELSGDDYAVLAKLAQQVKGLIEDVPNLVDLDDDYDKGKPEVRVNVDRQRAALAGLNTQFLGLTVKAAINGLKAGEYREGDKEYDVMVRFPKAFRETVSNLETMTLINLGGKAIPFTAVARVEQAGGMGSVKHINRKRTVTVSAEVEGRTGPQVLADVQARLEGFDLPAGYSISYTGESEEMDESQRFLANAFVVALLLIALVMVAEFNSVLQPLIILSTVILSLSGVFMALIVFDMPFGIVMTGVAVIGLAGVVVNNGIVLIDFINQLRARGFSVTDAIVEAGMTRFRPVMLTALTTVIGLVPMAMGVGFDFRHLKWLKGGESSEWWAPMAIAFIVGLLFATLLTLFVVPTLYSAIESLRRLLGSAEKEEPAAPTEAVPAK